MEFTRINKMAFVVSVLMIALLIADGIGKTCGVPAQQVVSVNSGPHAGRVGMIVSAPWIGSLYNNRPTVNVAATEPEILARYGGYGGLMEQKLNEMRAGSVPREWIKVWLSNTTPARIDNPYLLQDGGNAEPMP